MAEPCETAEDRVTNPATEKALDVEVRNRPESDHRVNNTVAGPNGVQLVMFNKHAEPDTADGDPTLYDPANREPLSPDKRRALAHIYEDEGILASSEDIPYQKVRVDVSVVFLKIGEIDTLKENYQADVMIKAKWREPKLDKGPDFPDSIDWSKYWNPKLFVENTVGEPRESSFQMLMHNEMGEAYLIEKKRCKGTFLENLELKDFPFDVQDLTITVMSERSPYEIELKDDPDDPHRVNKQSFIDEQEWLLYKYIESEIKEVANEYADPAIRRSAFSVKCRAARRPAYFVWNIFFITFLICSLSFATFSVDRRRPQNRLQLSFTLVLTSVAFKFVVNQSLPKISYLTYLDKYVLAAMILLSLVCTWHGITPSFVASDKNGWKIEAVALALFVTCYALFNILFIVRIYKLPGRKRRIMTKKEREYTEMVLKVIGERKVALQGFQSPANHLTSI